MPHLVTCNLRRPFSFGPLGFMALLEQEANMCLLKQVKIP